MINRQAVHQKHTLPPLATGTPIDLLWIDGDEGVAFGKHRGDWATVTLPATLFRMDYRHPSQSL